MNPHAVTVRSDSQKPFDTGRNNQIKKKNKEKDKGANQFIIILKCRLSVQDLHQGFGHLFHISMLKRWFGVDGLLVVASLFTLQLQLHPLGSWCNLSNKFKTKLCTQREDTHIQSRRMNFKVGEEGGRGAWNTEKYRQPPWLADKKNFRILDALEWLKK